MTPLATLPVATIRPMLVMGTRPEAIKMGPIVHECARVRDMDPIICFTGQHREMLAQVADYFGIRPDLNLNLMRPNQSLAGFTAACLEGLDGALVRYRPDYVIAQGDTTTVLCASLAAFYRRIPFVHVEAGLRTGNLQSPWPEEYNRRIAGLGASIHCAPTQNAADNLLREGVPPRKVHVTGNTVIDALLWTVARERQCDDRWRDKFSYLGGSRVVLVTCHRRESFGNKFEAVCQSIAGLARMFPDTHFVYPVHLNPNVREPVYRLLGNDANIHLTEPAVYPEFVWLMDRSTLILTDSGGVQEEAPSLRKPVLVMRDTTERPEAVDAGAVQLVGTDPETIVAAAATLLTDAQAYARHQIDRNPYGTGKAAAKIIELIVSQTKARSTALRSAA